MRKNMDGTAGLQHKGCAAEPRRVEAGRLPDNWELFLERGEGRRDRCGLVGHGERKEKRAMRNKGCGCVCSQMGKVGSCGWVKFFSAGGGEMDEGK